MLDILSEKYGEDGRIYFGNGIKTTIKDFRTYVISKSNNSRYGKLIASKNADGTLSWSPLNKLDSNYTDNSRELMKFAQNSLSEDEFKRFVVTTNLFNEGKLSFEGYEDELNFVLNKLKKDKKYPKKWTKNPESFTQSSIKNTETGNKSEQKIIDVFKNVGFDIIGYPLEGNPVDRLLNIDLIIKDTNGFFGEKGKILTIQVKTAQNIIYDSQRKGFILNDITINKKNQIDVAAYVTTNGDYFITKNFKVGYNITVKNKNGKESTKLFIPMVDGNYMTNIKY
jgi:hypothetical protein